MVLKGHAECFVLVVEMFGEGEGDGARADEHHVSSKQRNTI